MKRGLLEEFCFECETGFYRCKRCGDGAHRSKVGDLAFKEHLCKDCYKKEHSYSKRSRK